MPLENELIDVLDIVEIWLENMPGRPTCKSLFCSHCLWKMVLFGFYFQERSRPMSAMLASSTCSALFAMRTAMCAHRLLSTAC